MRHDSYARRAGLVSVTVLSAALLLALAPARDTAAADAVPAKKTTAAELLRSISPSVGHLVVHPKLKLKSSGPLEVTCCTHWNTSTGGTGCATYPDTCPDNTFTVECGDDGCW
jgi:hypothetical protein